MEPMPSRCPRSIPPLFAAAACSRARWGSAGLTVALVVALAGCGDDDMPPPVDAGVDAADAGGDGGAPDPIIADRPECENLDPTTCLMPYPSSWFLEEDPTTNTGFRVAIDEAAFPRNQFGEGVSRTSTWNRFDGFSPMGSMVTGFEGKVDSANLPNEDRIRDSLASESPTVLLDPETGERVAHFSEIDEWYNADPDRTTFYIRPATRLKENHRYVVAIRDLTLVDGSPVEPSAYFRALRDGTPTEVAELEGRRPAMERVFSDLAAAGVPRDDLILAWDFHTASGESLWGPMVQLREDALRRFGERTDGVGTCTVESVEEGASVPSNVFRRIRGTFTVPLYMESQYEGALLHRDDSGAITYNGTAEAPFEVVVPLSVRDRLMAGGEPARMLMYGHGLLGSARQVSSGGTREALQRSEMIGFGTDYWGLAESDDAQFINHVVTQFGNFDQVGERLVQGTINSLLLQKTFAPGGPCAAMPELELDVGGELRRMNGDELYYYGISQGGIMGGTLAALSDTIDAYVLQVGGMGYSTMVRRSIDFEPFERVFELWYTDKLERDWFIVSTQTMWDYAEPATYVPHIFRDPLPGVDTSARRVLYQASRWDAQVSNVCSDIAARTMQLPWIRSSVYEPYGVAEGILPATDGPSDSAYVIFQLDDVEPIPQGTAIADEDNSAHNDLRYLDPMLEQLDRFCRPDGQVFDTCPAGSCLLENTRR